MAIYDNAWAERGLKNAMLGRWALCELVLGVLSAVAAGPVCTDRNATSCGGQFCDLPVVARPGCVFSGLPFMCVTSNLTGECKLCPSGWTASGAFCVQCDGLSSCDRNGVVGCKGACLPRKYPTCDASGIVTCQTCSNINETLLQQGKQILTRGGVLDAPELCAAYFQCYTGYYLASTGSSGNLSCQACEFPDTSSVARVFLSHGLTYGDKFSCLYASVQASPGNNSLGEYGWPAQSCPPGMTSQPGQAPALANCTACPNVPAFCGFDPAAPGCVPVCQDGFVLRGEACVRSDLREVVCDGLDGYDPVDGACRSSVLPWNQLDKQALPSVTATIQAHEDGARSAMDQNGDFRVLSGSGALARDGVADFCANQKTTLQNVGYVQDQPLFTQKCGDLESHKIYMVVSGVSYLYAFLERSFGNNNRFVMWQIRKSSPVPGQVWQTFRLPAKVCSAVVVPGDYVYMAFCQATMIVYARQLDLFMGGATDPDAPPIVASGTQYVIGRKLGVLIGQNVAGNADGMRDQALFKGPLSLAWSASRPSRLMVADYGNCRIVEVVVDSPGSFLTRATTLASGCFSGDFPLPFPRLATSVLGGAVTLFVTDAGLVQLDDKLRQFSLVFTADQLKSAVGEPTWVQVAQDGWQVVLYNATHKVTVSRDQVNCTAGQRSRPGGACVPCPTGTFASGGACSPCTDRICPENTTLVACSGSADSSCRACVRPSVGYAYRFGADCTVIPKFPCPAGFFGLDDCFPCSSPLMFRQWPAHAYCQCLAGFALGQNKTCSVASPLPARPDWVSPLRCMYPSPNEDGDGNCTDFGCYLASVQPRVCLSCPSGKYSDDGLECKVCAGFRQPSPARDACVCRPPTLLSADGLGCVCPAGYAGGGVSGCLPCSAGMMRASVTVLPDSYENFQDGKCSFCAPGSEPAPGQISCQACKPGWYREGAMTACGSCPDPQAFAVDPARASSCTACQFGCGFGQRWDPCPVISGMYACRGCPPLPMFRTYLPFRTNCEWACVPSFYERNGDCFPCTNTECPLGFQKTQCSRYEDAHCRVPCRNETKPEDNSEWGPGCAWKCKAGYVAVKKSFWAVGQGWVEYFCDVKENLPWSIGV